MKTLKGIAASPGLAAGPAFVVTKEKPVLPGECMDPETEWQRFTQSAQQVANHLSRLSEAAQTGGGAQIFSAYAGMMDDPVLLDKIKEIIFLQKQNAAFAVHTAVEDFARQLESSDVPELKDRAYDLREVGQLVIRRFSTDHSADPLDDGNGFSPPYVLPRPSIIVADDLTFLDTARFEPSMVLGYCLARGGSGGHTAILARAAGIPAVVGAGPGVLNRIMGKTLLLNGDEGTVTIEPDTETMNRFRGRKSRQDHVSARAVSQSSESAVTRDGCKIEVYANTGDEKSAEHAAQSGADGIGLFRTEFLCTPSRPLPDEEQQYRVYTSVLSHFKDKTVILRTFDLGGDKPVPSLHLPQESNPFLGLRGIRLGLAHYDTILKPQLRAAVRAGQTGNLFLMLPMVSCPQEIIDVRVKIGECTRQLIEEGFPVSREIPVGIMVETPAAAVMARSLAVSADFFSIGTNDLTQYTMAADRGNPAVSHLITGLRPAVIRMVHFAVQGAANTGKPVGVCGELAGDPRAVPILLGLGVRELSVNPRDVPLIKHFIRQLNLNSAREIARRAMMRDTPEDVEALVKKYMKDITGITDITGIKNLKSFPRRNTRAVN